MSEDIFVEDEFKEVFSEDNIPCFGEYGKWKLCPDCGLREKCKKFTEAEREVTIRSKGKYSFRGKKRRRDRY